jgi:hypothetical protein
MQNAEKLVIELWKQYKKAESELDGTKWRTNRMHVSYGKYLGANEAMRILTGKYWNPCTLQENTK